MENENVLISIIELNLTKTNFSYLIGTHWYGGEGAQIYEFSDVQPMGYKLYLKFTCASLFRKFLMTV